MPKSTTKKYSARRQTKHRSRRSRTHRGGKDFKISGERARSKAEANPTKKATQEPSDCGCKIMKPETGDFCGDSVVEGTAYCTDHLKKQFHVEIKGKFPFGMRMYATGPSSRIAFEKDAVIIHCDNQGICARLGLGGAALDDWDPSFCTSSMDVLIRQSSDKDEINARYVNWKSENELVLKATKTIYGGDEIVADFTELIDLADEDDKVSRTLLTSDVFILLDGPAIFGDDPREMEKVGAVFEKLIKKHKHVFVQLGHDIGANDMRDLLREAGHKFKILNLDDHPYLY
ncbi:uncharacterized protein BJ171DRAFT_594492, partial [Polychytrium aggregatum]|uniref:uncharacterized protein n=1 Tax=Polychytrium aggregatum TaxID=110093 RepID=UPI0022FE5548